MNKVAKPISLLLLGLVFLGCGKSEKSAIEEAIRLELKKPEGELTQADYQKIKKLSVYSVARPVKDITLVGELTNLEQLDFAGGDISDPAPLAKLTKLWSLQVYNCGLKDFSALSGMDSLEELMASSNKVSNLSSLKGLTKLRVLALNNNLIKDTSPLLGLKSLKWVNLKGNSISQEAIGNLKKALPDCKIEHD
jgi:Leucine-rich repeat (LRR) protein